ncbi:GNAT family N-acetyltransferase [Clostridiales bacterium]|nr:GNAT family N-acetyltransferase [Clostridiales bacterium]
MMVQLEQVTKENIDAVLALDVNEDQKGFVSSTAESLAQAYAYSFTAFPFAVSDDGKIVGFIMMGFYEEKNYYTLWKLLIDRKYQHRGYGRKALELGIAFLKEWYGVSAVFTGVSPGNTAAKNLYRSMGFRETGLFENNMEEMRLDC